MLIKKSQVDQYLWITPMGSLPLSPNSTTVLENRDPLDEHKQHRIAKFATEATEPLAGLKSCLRQLTELRTPEKSL